MEALRTEIRLSSERPEAWFAPALREILSRTVRRNKFLSRFIGSRWGQAFIVFWLGKTLVFYYWLWELVQTPLFVDKIKTILIQIAPGPPWVPVRFGLFFLLLIASVPESHGSSMEMEMGKLWFSRRAEGAIGFQAKAQPIDRAITFFEQALDGNSKDLGVVMELMRCYNFKATFVPMPKSERRILYTRAIDLGYSILDEHPDSALLKFWLASLWGRWAEVHGAFASAREGLAHKIKSLCDEVIQLEPGLEDGGGYRILGLVHHHAPRIPIFLPWPSQKEALKYLEKAVSIAPTHVGNKFCLAQVYHDTGSSGKALQLLDEIIAQRPRPEKYLEDLEVLFRASELRQKVIVDISL